MRTNGSMPHDQLATQQQEGAGQGPWGGPRIRGEAYLLRGPGLLYSLPRLYLPHSPVRAQEAAGSLHTEASNQMPGLQHGLWESSLILQISVSLLQGCGEN